MWMSTQRRDAGSPDHAVPVSSRSSSSITVFHQTQEVRSGRGHRTPQWFVVKIVEFPQHDIVMPVEADA
jgi:hypothetical protein